MRSSATRLLQLLEIAAPASPAETANFIAANGCQMAFDRLGPQAIQGAARAFSDSEPEVARALQGSLDLYNKQGVHDFHNMTDPMQDAAFLKACAAVDAVL